MPENVYSYLDRAVYNPSSQRTLNVLPGSISNSDIIKFPQSLGGMQSIPFTIFMPYKRATGVSGFYSTKTSSDLYNQLPSPTFAIVLPTPTSALKTQYQATYSPFKVGQALGAASTEFVDLATKVMDSASGAKGAVFGAAAVAGAVAGALAGGAAVGAVIGAAALQAGIGELGADKDVINVAYGAADNPFTENVFKNIEFREHSFAYTFMPKSSGDSTRIDEIITLFKYGMLPKPGFAGYLDFPFEFQITHSIQDTTFTLLPSVLTSLDVDYGGGADSPKLFRPDSDGRQYPAKITLTLSFKEMVLLTRDRVMYDDAYKASEEDVIGAAKRYRF